ncbi:hypothetical protein BDZ91DRAFT_729348 [Kalaharituber pfeilii]|nr:hypothetical protein BDZ91DRAFT_729348 [Kalaharituber pfeilii]
MSRNLGYWEDEHSLPPSLPRHLQRHLRELKKNIALHFQWGKLQIEQKLHDEINQGHIAPNDPFAHDVYRANTQRELFRSKDDSPWLSEIGARCPHSRSRVNQQNFRPDVLIQHTTNPPFNHSEGLRNMLREFGNFISDGRLTEQPTQRAFATAIVEYSYNSLNDGLSAEIHAGYLQINASQEEQRFARLLDWRVEKFIILETSLYDITFTFDNALFGNFQEEIEQIVLHGQDA